MPKTGGEAFQLEQYLPDGPPFAEGTSVGLRDGFLRTELRIRDDSIDVSQHRRPRVHCGDDELLEVFRKIDTAGLMQLKVFTF